MPSVNRTGILSFPDETAFRRRGCAGGYCVPACGDLVLTQVKPVLLSA